MKRLVLMSVPALICGVLFLFVSSCSENSNSNAQEEVALPSSEFFAMGAKSSLVSSYDELDLLFTGDDIKMFKTGEPLDVANGGTFHGELVFTDLKADDLSKRFGHYTTVYFFIGETPVFDPPIRIYNPYSSMSANDLQMSIFDDKIYLVEFYQLWDWMPAAEREPKLKAQEENSKMREKQLDVFFKYLTDNSKLVK